MGGQLRVLKPVLGQLLSDAAEEKEENFGKLKKQREDLSLKGNDNRGE